MKGRRSTFEILFILNRSKKRKDGLCPILCRVTINTVPQTFSTKLFINSEMWDPDEEEATGQTRLALAVNKGLSGIEEEINRHYDEFIIRTGYVTSEMIKNAMQNIGTRQSNLLALFREHNEDYKKRIGIDRKKHALKPYGWTYNHLEKYIKKTYDGAEDVSLKSLTRKFIEGFHCYMRTDAGLSANTASCYDILLIKIVKLAVTQRTIRCNPFRNFKTEKPAMACRHNSAEELDRILAVEIPDPATCFVRDMFVFATFTGVSHADISTLEEKHIFEEADGNLWIIKNREKTGTEFAVKLLPIPLMIMEKYRKDRTGPKIFNVGNRDQVAYHLNKIQAMCNVEKLTFHMARHNFGTHITVSEDVPIMSVARMMGHKHPHVTETYAKVLGTKVSKDMKKLRGKMDGKYSIYPADATPVAI